MLNEELVPVKGRIDESTFPTFSNIHTTIWIAFAVKAELFYS